MQTIELGELPLKPVKLFTEKDIIMDWLSIGVNRNQLPIMRVDDPGYLRAIKDMADVYSFSDDEEQTVYFFNKNFFKIREQFDDGKYAWRNKYNSEARFHYETEDDFQRMKNYIQ